MKTKSIFTGKVKFVLATFIFTLLLILREYYSGGVITHYLLAREDLPGFSNWWGLLTVSLLAIVTLSINSRERKGKIFEINDSQFLRRLLGGFVFGVIISLLWEFDLEHILRYFILLPIVIAIFKPVHFLEYLLGFVLGMLFSFGGVLPNIIGTVLLIACFVVNKLVQIIKNLIV
ncbi:hypothetical protein [Tenacibaculum sp. 190524A02b]|uniref:hypothetical protein n=1 Tax=Tenacibaculum vairaonense TaxID=3137860 RepID=UPI0032B247F9